MCLMDKDDGMLPDYDGPVQIDLDFFMREANNRGLYYSSAFFSTPS